MRSRSSTNKIVRFLSGTVVFVLALLTGAFLGPLLMRLVTSPATDGWDGIADTLGALMVGAVVGAVAGCALLVWRREGGHGLLIVSLLVLLVGAGIFNAVLPKRGFAQPEQPVPFAPHFEIKLYSRAAPGETTAPSSDKSFSYRELGVSATSRSLLSKSWGAARTACSAELSESELEALAEIARELYELRPAACESDGPGYTLLVSWLDETHGVYVEPGCFAAMTPMQNFLTRSEEALKLRRNDGRCPG